MPGHVHLVLGPVGAGKSTFAASLADETGGLRLDLDEWMLHLFRPDRPDGNHVQWYAERAERCVDQIWRITLEATRRNTDVILEIGMLRRAQRDSLYGWVDAAALDLTVHVLDAPREVRRQRVERRNEAQGDTFVMVVPPHIFELASDMWEPPTEDEMAGRDFRVR